jgi:hypothetical protein
MDTRCWTVPPSFAMTWMRLLGISSTTPVSTAAIPSGLRSQQIAHHLHDVLLDVRSRVTLLEYLLIEAKKQCLPRQGNQNRL